MAPSDRCKLLVEWVEFAVQMLDILCRSKIGFKSFKQLGSKAASCPCDCKQLPLFVIMSLVFSCPGKLLDVEVM